MTRPAHRLSPRLLELESRLVPAGNVTVTQLGTELRVIGDAAANTFTVLGRGPGVVEIQGTGTTINGANAKVTVTGVSWLRVAGRENNDVIKTRDLDITTVHLFGEGGNDVLDIIGGTGKVFWALGGNGEDTIRTHSMAYGDVNVYGQGGNDVLDLIGTTGGALSLDLFTDTGLLLSASGGDGDDTIRVTGTDVRGDLGGIFIDGDDGRNSITVSNFRVAPAGEFGGILNLSVYNGYNGQPGPGNDITIDGLSSTMVAPDSEPYLGWFSWYIDINGADGDDTIRLRNWDLTGRGNDTDVFGDMYVYGSEGNDRIEVENATWSISTPAGIGRFNQAWSNFDADQVKMRNVRHEGGVFDGTGSSGSILGITAADADLKNVAVTSATGFANLYMQSSSDDPSRDTSFTLDNVTVRGGRGGFTDFYTVDGNDAIRATNCNLGQVSATLGEGDDSLAFVNVEFYAPRLVYPWGEFGGIQTGGGDDTVSLTNCRGENLYVDTGDGDDTVNVTNCVFLAADLFGGDGTDDLNLTNCTGLFTPHGFEL